MAADDPVVQGATASTAMVLNNRSLSSSGKSLNSPHRHNIV